jgi:hypothetical protein
MFPISNKKPKRPLHTLPRLALILLMAAALFASLPTASLANSALPPSIVFIVSNPPKDFTIEEVATRQKGNLYITSHTETPRYMRRAWEGYYAFYNFASVDSSRFRAFGGGVDFEFGLPPEYNGEYGALQYRTVFQLDLKTQTLTPVQDDWFRSFLLISLRVIATLVIEGLILLAFRFRKPLSWLSFVLVNLCTQGFLNYMLHSHTPLFSQNIMGFMIYEVLVLFIELAVLSPLLYFAERPKVPGSRDILAYSIIFVLAANTASLVLGFFLLACLPL